MNIIVDTETLSLFLATTTDPALRSLAQHVFARTAAQGFSDMTCICILAADVPLSGLATLIGTDPLEVAWDWRLDHGPWVEFGLTAGDGGFAHIVLVEAHDTRLAT